MEASQHSLDPFMDQRQSLPSPRRLELPLKPELLEPLQVRLGTAQGHLPIPLSAESHPELGWPRRAENLLNLHPTYVTGYTLRSLRTNPISFSDTDPNPQTTFSVWRQLRETPLVMAQRPLSHPCHTLLNTGSKTHPAAPVGTKRWIWSMCTISPSYCSRYQVPEKKRKKNAVREEMPLSINKIQGVFQNFEKHSYYSPV